MTDVSELNGVMPFVLNFTDIPYSVFTTMMWGLCLWWRRLRIMQFFGTWCRVTFTNTRFRKLTLFSASVQMTAGGPFGTAINVDQSKRRHILEYYIIFNIVIRKVRMKSTGGWVNIHRWTKTFQSFNTIRLEKQVQGTSFRAWSRYSFTSF